MVDSNARNRVGVWFAALSSLALAGCGASVSDEAGTSRNTVSSAPSGAQTGTTEVLQEAQANCGYSLTSGTYSTWPGGYQGWVEVKNVSGPVATDFEVLVDVGNTQIVSGYQAEFSEGDDGYLVGAPSWLAYQKIPQGQSFTFGFIGSGTFEEITPYLLSINGQGCDLVPPVVDLTLSQSLVTSEATLTLAAEASDDVAVRKVVFERDGEVVGEDREAPYSLELPLTAADNGRHVYSATAVDPSGNAATDSERILVAIDNRFVGTAVRSPSDYDDLLTYFDQLTPENAGKWGVVETTRDEMDFAELDEAYDFAQQNGLRFRLHTLVWGQQQPSWLGSLSPEEQLQELEQWMAALAARYEHLDMIDVVNEPLRSPPSYTEALGGAGETGFDWVISAFELAREFFPDAELVLNEYQVLLHPDFTNEYLELVQLLLDRGLLDGIGVQGHFLERAEIPVVEANLATLAQTGLPIYVTEFDVNFENDARHANVYAELFQTFWENPSVLGVTHWGHAEGNTWQPYTYLIRQDGTPRPALQWLVCYLAGGEDCSLPEYVPETWVGDENGLTLEAELWDEADGVLALGSSVAYTDPGDWLSFSSVLFDESWNKLWVTYAKGNTEVGSISIILDDLQNEPVITVELPPTAGWGSFDTLELELDSIAGEHAVFVRFNDVYGVANLDKIRFGKPAPETSYNIVPNGDFEVDASGWYSWNGGVVSVSTDRARSGNQSLLVTGTGTGPAATDLAALVDAGVTYELSFWVTVGNIESSDVRLTVALGCDGSSQYLTLANNPSVSDGEWAQLAGSVTVPSGCQVTQFQPYVEGNGANVDLYVDDVEVMAPFKEAPNLILNGDFETDTSGWFSWVADLQVSSVRAYTGSQSLLATGGGTGPVATNLATLAQPGTTYDISFWVTVGGVPSSDVRLTMALACSGGEIAFSTLANNPEVLDGEWVELAGSVTVPEDCSVTQFQPYVEGNGANVDLYVDNVRVAGPPPGSDPVNLLPNGEFEQTTNGWYSWGDTTLALTTDRAHGGAQSLLVTGSGTGPAATSVAALVEAGNTYDVSFWVTIGNAASSDVSLTLALGCGADPVSYMVLDSDPAVVDGEWVELAGSVTIPVDCDVTVFQPYAQGGGSNVDLYVDSVFIGY